MANNYAQGTFAPYIPASLITPEFEKLADAVGVTVNRFNDDDDMVYLFNDGYCNSGYIKNEEGEEKEVTDEDLYEGIQDIIRRSEGRLTWVSHEQAYTCDKMQQGWFGGSAVFITADDIQYHGTSSWLERRIDEAETGDTGPDTKDSPETPKAIFRDGSEALTPDGAWVAIGNISVHVSRKDDGVSVSLYPKGVEDSDSIAETWATFTECETDKDTGLFCGVMSQKDTPSEVQKTLDQMFPIKVTDIIEASGDLINAAKLVVERWEFGNLAEAVTNLHLAADMMEYTIEKAKSQAMPQLQTSGMLNDQALLLAASYFLPDSDTLTLEEQLTALEKAKTDDLPDGVVAWQPFENSTSSELYSDIEDLRDLIQSGMEFAYELANVAPQQNTSQSEVNLAIVIDGGLVQAVVTDAPETFKGVNTMIIDYDTEFLESTDDSLGLIPQEGYKLKTAHIQQSYIDNAGIDLKRVAEFVSNKAYGADQERFAICGENPCEGCEDCNTDGDRCVNEDKCLAWQYYNNN